jgi:hypothetical protein
MVTEGFQITPESSQHLRLSAGPDLIRHQFRLRPARFCATMTAWPNLRFGSRTLAPTEA